MKLSIIEKALIAYASCQDCSADDFHDAVVAIRECSATRERYSDIDTWRGVVQIIPQPALIDFLNMATYDVFGKRQKQSENYISGNNLQYYLHDCRSQVPGCEVLTNDQLACGYDFLSDLWRDNEAYDQNNPDGTCKK